MSFIAQGNTVIWVTEGGPYALSAHEIETLLAIFDRNDAIRPWLDLDTAAQKAGYPGSLTSMVPVRAA